MNDISPPNWDEPPLELYASEAIGPEARPIDQISIGHLDQPIPITFFTHKTATQKTEEAISLRALADRIRSTNRARKDWLPWLKLARFGDERTTPKSPATMGSLRHDKNVDAITGIEADYDGGKMDVATAVEILTRQGVASMVYTSPSHAPEAPRWRVLCPLSHELPPDQRTRMLGRLNGLLGGILAGESFTLSQSYFFGRVNNSPDHVVELIDGTPIDLHDDLDEIWIGRPGTQESGSTSTGPTSGPIDEAALIREITEGTSYHPAMIRLAGAWATAGVGYVEAGKRLNDLMNRTPEESRDDRWRARAGDIDRTLIYVFGKRMEEPVPGTASTDWPDPIALPDGLSSVAPFDENLLPAAFRPWVMDIANRMQCPPDFPAVAAIVTASAIIGRQIGIHPKRRDDWLVVPNLWGAVVGRPSLMKTPALAESRKMLQRLEFAARKTFDAEMAEYELTGSIGKLIAKERTKGAAKSIKQAIAGGENATEAARAAMKSDDDDEATPPVRRRYVTQDPTVEKLGELLTETPRGMLIFRDELIGFLRSMDKDGHENDRGFYLEAWNGTGAYTYDRIARGTLEIDAACVSILGGIQPGPLRAYISQANQGGAGDDGLLQRMQLLVWPDRGDEWVNVDEWPDTVAKNNVFDIMERLDRISPNEAGADIQSIRFDDVAQGVFNTWRESFERRFLSEDMPPALEAHLTKYRSLLPSLALIFHLIDTPDADAVAVQHVNRAAAWLVYLETHARRLYAQILDPGTVAAIALAARMRELPDPFTARDVYRRCWTGLDAEMTEKAIKTLVDFYHLRPEAVKKEGRPSTQYRRHPTINFYHSPKPCTVKTDKTPPPDPFGGFVSDTSKGMGEFFSDEVTF